MISKLRHMRPLDRGAVAGQCQGPVSQVDTVKCSHLWPSFPCYSRRKRACENTKGDTILMDPIDDMLYTLGKSYLSVLEAIGKFFDVIPKERRLESEEKLMRMFREQYSEDMTPLRKANLPWDLPLLGREVGRDHIRFTKHYKNLVDTAMPRRARRLSRR